MEDIVGWAFNMDIWEWFLVILAASLLMLFLSILQVYFRKKEQMLVCLCLLLLEGLGLLGMIAVTVIYLAGHVSRLYTQISTVTLPPIAVVTIVVGVILAFVTYPLFERLTEKLDAFVMGSLRRLLKR